jgi:hypothetical protein
MFCIPHVVVPTELVVGIAAEDAYLQTLRTHFVRNGTAETSLPTSWAARRYRAPGSPGHMSTLSPGRAAGLVGAVTSPGRSPALTGSVATSPGKSALAIPGSALEQQELALWEEREHELLEAQVRVACSTFASPPAVPAAEAPWPRGAGSPWKLTI